MNELLYKWQCKCVSVFCVLNLASASYNKELYENDVAIINLKLLKIILDFLKKIFKFEKICKKKLFFKVS